MADFSYTNFKTGNVSIIPNIPSSFFDYTNYVVFAGGGATYVVCFDKVLECKKDYYGYHCNESNGSFLKVFRFHSTSGNWFEHDTIIIGSNFEIVSCSDNLLKYIDLFKSGDFYLDLTLDEVSLYTLQPIIQEAHQKDNFLTSVFDEVFGVLPVLITVFISLIGIKKGFSFLISQIKKS